MSIISFCVKFSPFFFKFEIQFAYEEKKYNVILLYKETENFLTNNGKNDLFTEFYVPNKIEKKTTLMNEIKCKTVGF